MQRGACIILQRQFYANIMFMGYCLTHDNITFNANEVTKLIKICMQFIPYTIKNEIENQMVMKTYRQATVCRII